MLEFSELPSRDGLITGRYRLRYADLTAVVRGATFVDGVTQNPVDGRDVQRLRYAYGAGCSIEPYDEETLAAVASHLAVRRQPVLVNQLRDYLAGVMAMTGKGSQSELDRVVPSTDVQRTAPVAPAASPPAATVPAHSEAPIRADPPVIDADVDTVDDRSALIATAEALGIDVDGRWGVGRVKSEIRRVRDGEE